MKTHGDIIGLLENQQLTRKLICVPRGCLKSSIACVAYPIWLLINNPDLRILIDSELYSNSATFVREIKNHLTAPIFTEVFGNWVGDVWTQGEIVIKPRQKNLKEPSVSAGGIGTQKTGLHMDVIVHDDMNSATNSNTLENCKKVIEHFRLNTSILEPHGTMLVIGTRYSASDLIGWILETQEHEAYGVSA